MKVLSLEKLTEFVELVKTNFASKTDLNNKVDKVGGKQLSTNDYTTAEKNKLATLEALTVKSVKVNGSPLVPDGSKAVNVDLSGYAVKTEVTQEIAQAVSGITGFDTQAVEELPGTGKKGILYLLSNSGSGNNVYDEYLWLGNKYEKLGTREINLTEYAKKTELPTKVSQLTNDSGYQTSAQVGNIVDTKIVNKVDKVSGKQLSTNDYTTAEKNKLATLEALTVKSVKVNGSPLVPDGSKAVNVDLSGYAVKTEVTQEIAQAVSGITGFDTQAVEELPGTGKKGILYLLSNSGSGNNVYDEYLWLGNKYEKLGTREINLTEYAKKTELPTKVSQLTNDSGYQTSAQVGNIVDTKIVNKVDKVSGKQLSTNDYTTAEKNKLADLVKVEEITTEEIEALF